MGKPTTEHVKSSEKWGYSVTREQLARLWEHSTGRMTRRLVLAALCAGSLSACVVTDTAKAGLELTGAVAGATVGAGWELTKAGATIGKAGVQVVPALAETAWQVGGAGVDLAQAVLENPEGTLALIEQACLLYGIPVPSGVLAVQKLLSRASDAAYYARIVGNYVKTLPVEEQENAIRIFKQRTGGDRLVAEMRE